MFIPDRPIHFAQLSPELRAEGLDVLRDLIRENFIDGEFLTDEEILSKLQCFDLRLLMRQNDDGPDTEC
jgi:hypothetical protein